jgi:signal transduction histidine kinase
MEQRAAEASRSLLFSILTSLPQPVVVVDDSGRAIVTNISYDTLLAGAQLEPRLRDASGQPIPPRESPLARAARGDSFTMEVLLTTQGGETRRFEAIGRPVLPGEGESARGVVVLHDVTDRTLVLLGQEFVSLATHELRTPLTAAGAYIELLHSMLSSQFPNEQLAHLAGQALTAVRRLGDRITDLADVQSVQSGKLRLDAQRVDLTSLVGQVVEVAQMLARGQKIALESAPGPQMADVDPRRIEQVVTNLLTNAITYAPDTERIDVRLRQSGHRVEIQVEDYGPGIPAVDLQTLFSRFFPVARSTPTSHHGLGLGLYLAKEIVDAHGGTISVDSIEGKGATFTVTLPLVEE